MIFKLCDEEKNKKNKYLLGESKSTPNWTSKLTALVLLDPSGMTTADLGILVDGGGGLTLWIFKILFWADDDAPDVVAADAIFGWCVCCFKSLFEAVVVDDDGLGTVLDLEMLVDGCWELLVFVIVCFFDDVTIWNKF